MLRMLLRQDVADRIGRLFKSGIVPTAQQRDEFHAHRVQRRADRLGARASSSEPENYVVVGSVAQICIEGVLSEEPDFWAWLFGMDGTTYEDIRDAFALAGADPLVTSVSLAVSSPGGYVDGLFDTLAAVEAFAKPISVVASQACSAAYSLAAMAGKIRATGPSAEFGSVGVCAEYYVDPQVVSIASTEAPNKRPDLTTEEGRAVVRAELDAVHDLFVDAIARGRKNATGESYSVDRINADFGRGGVKLAKDALSSGMIDKLTKTPKRGSAQASDDEGEEIPPTPETLATAEDGGAKEEKPMDLKTLKAQHPDLYTAIFDEGKTAGLTGERDRVVGHLTLAEGSGDMKTALASIASGEGMTAAVQAKHMKAAMGRNDQSARQEESNAAGAAVTGAAPVATEGGKDLTDQVAEKMAGLKGKKLT